MTMVTVAHLFSPARTLRIVTCEFCGHKRYLSMGLHGSHWVRDAEGRARLIDCRGIEVSP